MQEKPEEQYIRHAYNIPKTDRWVYRRYGFNSYVPSEFTDTFDEAMSWKTSCSIGDWSPLWKLMVTGPDALAFFSGLTVNTFLKFDIGQAKHAIFCNGSGKLTGDGVLMRLGEDKFFYQSGPGVPWAQFQFDKGNFDATCEHVTNDWFTFQVSGPNSLFLLEQLAGESLRDIGFMRFRETTIAGMPCYALRQGMSGELGYELHGSSLYGRAIYAAIVEAGEAFGLRQIGARTLQVNHVEACFPTSTVDYVPAMHGEGERAYFEAVRRANPLASLDVMKNSGSFELTANSEMYRSPIELGWARNVKFDHDFLGREALEEEIKAPQRKVVTLVWNSDDVVDIYAALFRKEDLPPFMELPRHAAEHGVWADAVTKDGSVVGISTSRCYSVFFREMLSLCVIEIALAEPGTEVEILWGKENQAQRRIRATVAPAPYKRDNRKIDVNTLPSYI